MLPKSMTPEVAQWLLNNMYEVATSAWNTPDEMLEFKKYFNIPKEDYEALKVLAVNETTDQQIRREMREDLD